MTKRTSGRSMPIPNALVATIVAPAMKIFWVSSRAARLSPAWYGRTRSRCAYVSVSSRVAAYTMPVPLNCVAASSTAASLSAASWKARTAR